MCRPKKNLLLGIENKDRKTVTSYPKQPSFKVGLYIIGYLYTLSMYVFPSKPVQPWPAADLIGHLNHAVTCQEMFWL